MREELLVAVYEKKEDVKEAVKKLMENGIDRKMISVIAKGHEEAIEKYEIEKENSDILFWGAQGAFWGAILGALAGGIFFIVPGFGPIVGAGPIAAALSGALGGALTGGAIFSLADALIEWGLDEIEAKRLEDLVRQGKYLLLVHADEDIVNKAKEILDETPAKEIEIL